MSRPVRGVSIVIPVLNEAGNITNLIKRIENSLSSSAYGYEIIFVDDHSSDDTKALVQKAQMNNLAISFRTKQGSRGKAFSVIEGFSYAHFDTVCMIDADLQYAPEAIVPMLDQMNSKGSDVVVSNRVSHETSFIRRVTSNAFHLIFTKWLFGIEYDTQSGLKVFRNEILRNIHIAPSPWSFDLQFIVFSILRGYSVSSYDIEFFERTAETAKVNVLATSFELAKASIELRLKISKSELLKQYRSTDSTA